MINSLWNKYSDKLYKTFPKFMFTESLLYLILHLCVIAGLANAVTYYIVDTVLFCLITKNMICGGNKLRSLVYKDEEREKYDNIVPIASAISTLIGAGIAFLIGIPIKIAFVLSWMGITVDNIFYYIAYKKNMAAE
ncbi:MAG: hypothetical protein K2N51_01225 [Lachnospiraceae bacterium]|nr:hypothetical protein [Lachnospiraceae bacterium]